MKEVRPRVTGTEVEWAVGLRHVDDPEFRQAQSQLAIITKYASKAIYNYSNFLRNGARCYRDGDLLEYATGEEDTFIGTVAAEYAGEQIIRESVSKYVDANEDLDGYQLLKRAYLNTGVSAGYHISLCADATAFKLNENDLYDLGLHTATVSMFTGAGCAYETSSEGPIRLAIAQKSTEVQRGFALNTTSYKPLICLRHEPLGDPDQFHRIQIVGLDPNISPWASWMQIGTASLCLRAIEQGVKGKYMRLREYSTSDPKVKDQPLARLARAVAFNPDLDTVVELEDGTTIKVVDIQREEYLKAAATEHTDEETRILQNWDRVLNDIDGDRSFLKSKAGWPVRHDALRRYADKHKLSLRDNQLIAPDRNWDANKNGSMAETLRTRLWSEDMPFELIEHRRDNPCPNTRATLRSDALHSAGRDEKFRTGWSWYKHPNEHKVILRDPLLTSVPEYRSSDDTYREPNDEDEEDTDIPNGYRH